MTIYFYTTNQPYGEFSNFSKHGVELDGLWWKTTEHYFQAQKFTDETYKEKIRLAPDPKTAANLGRSRKMPIKKDWEAVKTRLFISSFVKWFRFYRCLSPARERKGFWVLKWADYRAVLPS